MRITVIVGQSLDPLSVELRTGGGEIDETRAMYEMSPADRAALQMGLRLAEAAGDGGDGGDGSVAVYSVGPVRTEAVLRECLALGAHTITRIWDEHLDEADPATCAQALAAALANGVYDVILTGNRGADQGPAVVGPMLAELLHLPQVTAVDALRVGGKPGELVVRRRLDRGAQEELAVALPALCCIEPGVVEPRAASLPALLASRDAPVPVSRPLGPVSRSSPRLVSIHAPRPRPHRVPAPSSGAPVETRLATILGTGQSPSAHMLVEGTPEELVERIIHLLAQRGYV